MFISPTAPDTPKNRFWRKCELYFSLSLGLYAAYAMMIESYYLSHKLADSNKIVGLKQSTFPWTSYIDLYDGQLSSFRESLPLLSLFAFVFIVFRKILLRFKPELETQLTYYIIFGLGYAGYIHGPGVIYLVLMVAVNYFLVENFAGKKFFAISIWVLNLGFLIITELYTGYKFAWWSSSLAFLDRVPHDLPWWRVTNLCMLKVISYAMDYHWSILNLPTPTKEKHKLICSECTESIDCLDYRTKSHASHYSFKAFISYFFYPPLYLAGPTISYNAWISHVQVPQQTFDAKRLGMYILRFFMIYFILEWSIHNLYFPGIASNPRNKRLWEQFNVWELIATSYVILNWIWLKFTVIWRYFRIWALLDGIECVENMVRCMSNSYCFEQFWRMWHRSFNQWLVRYLFVPLGGRKYKIYNIWVVFGFVALWHDLTLKLLAWGWGMCIFIMPEVLAKAYFQQPKFAEFRKTLTYNWLCAFGGGFYIVLLMMANLIGFSFGIEGFYIAMREFSTPEGSWMLFKFTIYLGFCVHFMFAQRKAEEKFKGF